MGFESACNGWAWKKAFPLSRGLSAAGSKKRRRPSKAQNFEARKHLLEYDDVMNKQREAVYGLRHQLLEGVDQKELILEDYVSGNPERFDGSVLRPSRPIPTTGT